MKYSVASMCPSNEDTSMLVHVFTGLDLLCFTGLFGVFCQFKRGLRLRSIPAKI